ncbi:MAG: hypothetical protein ACU85V_09980 [Gammaproteobacteria bacterium]
MAVPLFTFDLTGNCTDCAAAAGADEHLVNISLTLRDYEPGERIRSRHFESFSYTGSNLVDDIFVGREDWLGGKRARLRGRAPADYGLGEALRFRLDLVAPSRDQALWSCTDLGAQTATGRTCRRTHRLFFSMNAAGDWQLGRPAKDVGLVTAATAAHVPEPATLGLVAGAACLVRRRGGAKR